MKISITKTVLEAMPDVAWRVFCRFSTDSNVEYSFEQKPAALSMRYYFAVYCDGHSGFFESYENMDKGELVQAMRDIGAGEFADNLVEAAESGTQEAFEKADAWFDENTDTLLDAIQGYLKSNTNEFFEIVDEDYTMLPPKYAFWAGAALAAVVFTFMTIIALTQTLVNYWLFFLMFFAIASPFLALIAYSLFWRVSVKKDVITIIRPFRKRRTIRIDEISNVRIRRDRLIVYTHGKKTVMIRKEASEYWMFLAQLDLAGRIKKIPLDSFSIRQERANIITRAMWPIIAGGVLIWAVTRQYNPAGVYELVLFAVLALVAFWYFLFCVALKITVSGDTISVKKVLGAEREYQFSDITKVAADDRTIAIYVRNRKLIQIDSDAEGYSALLQRLSDESIALSRKVSISGANKTKKHLRKKVPVEEQLRVLNDLGFKPQIENFVEWVCAEFSRESIESDPFDLLLCTLGGERELSDGRWEPLSDDVYNFDTECVEDNDIYATIFKRLAVISKGGFDISKVSSKVNHMRERASVAFSLDGKEYSWQLNYNGDWFDIEAIGRINYLLKSKGSDKFFYISNPDQSVTLVFETDEINKKLNGLVSASFGLSISDSE